MEQPCSSACAEDGTWSSLGILGSGNTLSSSDGSDAVGGTTVAGGTGGDTVAGGALTVGGTQSGGGTNAAGGTMNLGGSAASGGQGDTNSTSVAYQYCGATAITDMGTLRSDNQSGSIDATGTAVRCYRFAVIQSGVIFHGIQISNCNAGTVAVNGSTVCQPGTGAQCLGVISIERAPDGYWYVLFTPGTSTTCHASWWLY